jgi:hypothetical protein
MKQEQKHPTLRSRVDSNPLGAPNTIFLEISNLPQISYHETILIELIEYKDKTFLIKDKRSYKTLTDTLSRWQETHANFSQDPYSAWVDDKRSRFKSRFIDISDINLDPFCAPTPENEDDVTDSDEDLDETINNTQGHKISPIESRMNVLTPQAQAQVPAQLAREWNLESNQKTQKSKLTKSNSELDAHHTPLPVYPPASKPEEKPMGISLLTYESLHAD